MKTAYETEIAKRGWKCQVVMHERDGQMWASLAWYIPATVMHVGVPVASGSPPEMLDAINFENFDPIKGRIKIPEIRNSDDRRP